MPWCIPYRPKTRQTRTVLIPKNPTISPKYYLLFQIVGDPIDPALYPWWVIHGLIRAYREDGLAPSVKLQIRRFVRLCDSAGNYLTPNYQSQSGPPIPGVVYPSNYLKPDPSAHSIMTSGLQGNARDGLYFDPGGISQPYHEVIEVGVSIVSHSADVPVSIEYGHNVATGDLKYTDLGADGNPFFDLVKINGETTAFHLVDAPPAIEPAYHSQWITTFATRIRAVSHPAGEPPYGEEPPGPETIHKFQPNRTIQLRGADDRGAAACIHSATASGFTVEGVFRDLADAAVLVLWDTDNFYEHPRIKYLPDPDLSGVVVLFDLETTGLQTIDSSWYAGADWPFLDIAYLDGSSARVKLLDYAEPLGEYTQAVCNFEIHGVPTVGDYIGLSWLTEQYNYRLVAGDTLETAIVNLAQAINLFSTTAQATATGRMIQLTLKDVIPVADGNRVGAYGFVSGAKTEYWVNWWQTFVGGVSPPKWRVTLDFTALVDTTGLPIQAAQVRQCWLTFSPAINPAGDTGTTLWLARFTNWTVSGNNRELKIAGPGSVRIEESDAWCKYTGQSWVPMWGFYSKGLARRASTVGDKVTIRYHCQHVHNLYLGGSLGPDLGTWTVRVDGDTPTTLNCWCAESLQSTRRVLRTNLPVGQHEVVLTLASGEAVFDFIEAAVLSDVPDALPARAHVSPAIDWDTDHSYKVPAARLMWAMDNHGFTGPINEYVGVFFWCQRKRVGGDVQQSSVTFGGAAEFSKMATLWIGEEGDPERAQFTHVMTIGDTLETVARAFALRINQSSTVFWAEASGPLLSLHGRSTGKFWRAPVAFETNSATLTGAVTNENLWYTTGQWQVDIDQEPVLTVAAERWHADLFKECAARGREITSAFSMELFNTPDAAGNVWASRFNSGKKVLTAIVFGTESPCAVKSVAYGAPVVLEVPKHDYDTGDYITVTGVPGLTFANGRITKVDADHFSLDGSSAGGTYTLGGECFRHLRSTHCSFVENALNYQKRAYLQMAQLQASAGLTPGLQFGEFCWWYFAEDGSLAFYDTETRAAALAALGRELHVFEGADDDPATINSGEDGDWLAERLRAYCAEIAGYVRGFYPQAVFEILLPMDVNYPRPVGRYNLGGRLLHWVNIPPAFRDPAVAPFDYIKMEALDFGSGTRSLDLAREAIRWPFTEAQWPKAKCRYLVPVFNQGCPWEAEYLAAREAGVPLINLWAWDHVCLFGWRLDEPQRAESAQVV
jgi:hypothetical protein